MVDLPAPEGPTIATVSPGSTSRLKSFERGIFQPRGIAEGHVAERQAAARRFRQCLGPVGRRDARLRDQQFVETARRARTAQQIAVNFGQRAERTRHQPAGDDEGRDGPAGNGARGHADGAAPHQQRDRAEDQQDDDRCHRGADQDAAFGDGENLFHRITETGFLAPFLTEGLDDLHRRQHFGHHRADIGDPVLAGARDIAQAAPENGDRQDDRRNDQDQADGQRRGEIEQIGRAADRHQQIAQGNRDRGPDHLLDHRGVAGHTAGNFLGAVFVS